MSIKINKKIVDYGVVKAVAGKAGEGKRVPNKAPGNKSTGNKPTANKSAKNKAASDKGQIVQMHERLERPETLVGNTYKIKTPVSEHAFYITINDILLNPGTPYEKRRPFEIFVNSKNMDHYQWISGLTLIISAVFRKGGDVTFLVSELQSVFDPKGGYFKRGGKYMPSLVAEIGYAIESHLKKIGLITEPELEPHQQALVQQKRREYEDKQVQVPGSEATEVSGDFPPNAALCAKCNTRATVFMDGCMTCLNCGDSKCG